MTALDWAALGKLCGMLIISNPSIAGPLAQGPLEAPLEVRCEHDVRLAPATHFDGGLIARRVGINLGAQVHGGSDGMACKLVHDIVGFESRAGRDGPGRP